MTLPTLETDRLVLRAPVADDAGAIAEHLSDVQVARWMTRVPFPYAARDAEEFLALGRGRTPWKVWAICPGGGPLAGIIGLEGEFGYWLGRDHWGRGYMTEAARAVLAWHFRAPSAPPLASGYFVANARSRRVLSKLGFADLGAPHPVETRSFGVQSLQRMILVPEQWHALNPVFLRGAGIVLRPLWPEDAPRLAEIGGDASVAPMMLRMTSPWPVAEAAAWLEAGRWRGTPHVRLGIDDASGRLVGAVGLSPPGATLFYMVAPEAAGRGLASDAVATFLRWALDRFALDFVEADHFDDNPASGRILARLGFRAAGRGTAQSRGRLEPAPNTLYRLSRSDFSG